MASEKILQQKEEEVSKLAEKFKDAKLVLLTDYRGITVEDVTSLRNDLRNAKSEYKVIKNNIVKRALQANGENGLDSVLEGPTAVVMAEEDYLAPLKAIYKFSKDNEYYKIKGGIVEGKVMSVEELITLAKLPSRQELLGMLAGALLGNISKVAVALDQVRLQKEEA
ncbi:MAG: 50S ribosomal protein L10 [Clostridia bacterium]|nr:50S ribosomal protein L10 [Clostridia bacterium]